MIKITFLDASLIIFAFLGMEISNLLICQTVSTPQKLTWMFASRNHLQIVESPTNSRNLVWEKQGDHDFFCFQLQTINL